MNKKKKNKGQISGEKVSKKKTLDSSELKIILSILGLGFFIRLIYVLETNDSPFYLNLFSDSKIYFDWAKQIAVSGNWIGDEVFFMSPGYPYILAFIFNLFGASIFVIRIIQAIISTATIFLIFLSTKNIFGKTSGCYAAKGNNQSALENYQNALKINPEFPLAYFNIALLLTQLGNFDEALVNYNKTIKIDPSFSEAYRNMAIINYMNENYQQALSLFENYLSLISDEQTKATVQEDINEIKRRLEANNHNMNKDAR